MVASRKSIYSPVKYEHRSHASSAHKFPLAKCTDQRERDANRIESNRVLCWCSTIQAASGALWREDSHAEAEAEAKI